MGTGQNSRSDSANASAVAAFGYREFGTWYDAYRIDVLEPALVAAEQALVRELTDNLPDRDLARIRNIGGRVKSKRRTWRKLSQPRYRALLSSVDDVPQVIDDLVGLRVTCTNLRDLQMVQAALDELPRRPRGKRPLGLDPESERDYVDAPKDSGYRGWHVNLQLVHDKVPVTCELQIRTLLQDSWGELTHEDTYSKAGELPPLVEILSKRMADLLATLDDIAEDLRTELDRIDEAVVAAGGEGNEGGDAQSAVAAEALDEQPSSGLGADAAELLLDRWRSQDRPIELASLAWALQKEFGAEVSDNWFGAGTFKRFVRQAVPDGEISTGRKAYLLPPSVGSVSAVTDDVAEAADETPAESSIPDEARALRRIDRGFPLIETEQWSRVYEHLAEAWRRIGAHKPSTRMVNELTRSARDRARAVAEPVSRRHLDYVAKTVLAADDRGEPLNAAQIGDVLAEATLQRMADLRITDADNAPRRTAVARWLLG